LFTLRCVYVAIVAVCYVLRRYRVVVTLLLLICCVDYVVTLLLLLLLPLRALLRLLRLLLLVWCCWCLPVTCYDLRSHVAPFDLRSRCCYVGSRLWCRFRVSFTPRFCTLPATFVLFALFRCSRCLRYALRCCCRCCWWTLLRWCVCRLPRYPCTVCWVTGALPVAVCCVTRTPPTFARDLITFTLRTRTFVRSTVRLRCVWLLLRYVCVAHTCPLFVDYCTLLRVALHFDVCLYLPTLLVRCLPFGPLRWLIWFWLLDCCYPFAFDFVVDIARSAFVVRCLPPPVTFVFPFARVWCVAFALNVALRCVYLVVDSRLQIVVYAFPRWLLRVYRRSCPLLLRLLRLIALLCVCWPRCDVLITFILFDFAITHPVPNFPRALICSALCRLPFILLYYALWFGLLALLRCYRYGYAFTFHALYLFVRYLRLTFITDVPRCCSFDLLFGAGALPFTVFTLRDLGAFTFLRTFVPVVTLLSIVYAVIALFTLRLFTFPVALTLLLPILPGVDLLLPFIVWTLPIDLLDTFRCYMITAVVLFEFPLLCVARCVCCYALLYVPAFVVDVSLALRIIMPFWRLLNLVTAIRWWVLLRLRYPSCITRIKRLHTTRLPWRYIYTRLFPPPRVAILRLYRRITAFVTFAALRSRSTLLPTLFEAFTVIRLIVLYDWPLTVALRYRVVRSVLLRTIDWNAFPTRFVVVTQFVYALPLDCSRWLFLRWCVVGLLITNFAALLPFVLPLVAGCCNLPYDTAFILPRRVVAFAVPLPRLPLIAIYYVDPVVVAVCPVRRYSQRYWFALPLPRWRFLCLLFTYVLCVNVGRWLRCYILLAISRVVPVWLPFITTRLHVVLFRFVGAIGVVRCLCV